MARIDFPEGPNPFAPLQPRRKDEEKKAGKGRGLFGAALSRALEESRAETGSPASISAEPFAEAELEQLLDEVHLAGDRLKGNPSTELVQAYKRAVRDFIHQVVERSYALEEKSSGGNILKRKKFYRIAVIDQSLERLAAEILRNQRDQLEILRRVDEINGMLVDLLR